MAHTGAARLGHLPGRRLGQRGRAGQRAGMAWARAPSPRRPARPRGHGMFGAAPRLAVPLAHYKALPDPAVTRQALPTSARRCAWASSSLPPTAGRIGALSDGRDTRATRRRRGRRWPWRAACRSTPWASHPASARRSRARVDVPGRRARRRQHPHPHHRCIAPTHRRHADAVDRRRSRPSRRSRCRPATLSCAAEQTPGYDGLHTFRARIDTAGRRHSAEQCARRRDGRGAAGPHPAGRERPGRGDRAGHDAGARAHLHHADAGRRASGQRRGLSRLRRGRAGRCAGHRAEPRPADGAARRRLQRGLGLLAIGGPSSFGEGGYTRTTHRKCVAGHQRLHRRAASARRWRLMLVDRQIRLNGRRRRRRRQGRYGQGRGRPRRSTGWAMATPSACWPSTTATTGSYPSIPCRGLPTRRASASQISTPQRRRRHLHLPGAARRPSAPSCSVPTIYRHIVLLTDGQGEDADFNALVQRMHREHITLSTIGVGQDVVQDELRAWAKLAAASFTTSPTHTTFRASSSTRRATAAPARRRCMDTSTLGVAAASPLLRALAGHDLRLASTPTIRRCPNRRAQVALQSAAGDPILSSWQYGLGPRRSVDLRRRAATAWASAPGVPAAISPTSGSISCAGRCAATIPARRRADAAGAERAAAGLGAGAPGRRLLNDDASPRVRVVAPDGTAQVVPLSSERPRGCTRLNCRSAGPGVYTASLRSQ